MKDRTNTVIPKGFAVKKCPLKSAYGADTWAKKGGMMGGRGGSCSAVTSGNGVGVVPMAYNEYKHGA